MEHTFTTNSPRLLKILRRSLPSQLELVNRQLVIVAETDRTLVIEGDMEVARILDILVGNLRAKKFEPETLSLS